MKKHIQNVLFTLGLLAFTTLNSQFSTAHAQGTAFTYQGQLVSGGLPANGSYDLTFALFNSSGGGTQSGVTLTNTATAVSNGLFVVTLDFGSGIFTGTNYWLAVGVRTNGNGTFTALTPLQPITPTPYAVYSPNAGTSVSATTAAAANSVTSSSVTAAGIASGQVVKSLNGLHDAVLLTAGTNVVMSTNGNTLTLSAGGGAGWNLLGNPGTTAGVNFVGTTDNQPLEFHVNGQRVLRLEPTTTANSPNVIGGSSSENSSISATIGGGYFNNIQTANDSTIGGGYENSIQAGASWSTIGGGSSNTNSANDATIAGGAFNFIQSGASFSTIGGGGDNTNSANDATIAGGAFNLIQAGASFSTIGGGGDNTNFGGSATIGGGAYNTVQSAGTNAFIGGGVGNVNAGSAATVGGGYYNYIQSGANYSTIAGGDSNLIDTNSVSSIYNSSTFQYVSGAWVTIGGGLANTVSSAGSFIGGGYYNWIDTNSITYVIFPSGQNYLGGWSVLGGGAQNRISANASFIGGGGFNSIQTKAQWSAIGGGEGNMIDTNSYISTVYVPGSPLNNLSGGFSFIGGGAQNKIRTATSFIGGGNDNLVDLFSTGSAIGGGWQNSISNSTYSFIGAGSGNNIGANFVGASSGDSIIGGGTGNKILSGNATIGGGYANTIDTNGGLAAIGGGDHNYANGGDAMIPGGTYNVANGVESFAAGYEAQATNDYTFVWNDGPSVFPSTSSHQFLIHAISGVGINNNNPKATLDVNGSINAGSVTGAVLNATGYLNATSANFTGTLNVNYLSGYLGAAFTGPISATAFNVSSDRNVKENFRPVDDQAMLAKVAALPMTQWNYKQDSSGVQHIGPMAQDFQAAFGLNGRDDKHISLVDEGGVALAAIQGLNEKLEQQDKDKDAEIQTLKQQNDSLAKRLTELEAAVKSLAQQK